LRQALVLGRPDSLVVPRWSRMRL